jgi:uncharacterized protein
VPSMEMNKAEHVQMKESDSLERKVAAMSVLLEAHAPLVVAYSGGVDSAYLLAQGHRILGRGMLGVIADSASLPRQALADALALARSLGAEVEVVKTGELDNPEYAANPVNRCYFCKAELFTRLDELARGRGFRAIAYGENADDLRSVRPGRLAAEEFSVLAPLKEVGLGKEEIRALSRRLGLPTADAPAQPCLSSRIPHGTPVTVDALAMVEKGEAFLRGLGFRVFRVRHMVQQGGGATARVQVAPEEMGRLEGLQEGVLGAGLATAGYAAVEIDPAGYRAS